MPCRFDLCAMKYKWESMENGVSRKRLVLSPDSYSGIDTAIGLEIGPWRTK